MLNRMQVEMLRVELEESLSPVIIAFIEKTGVNIDYIKCSSEWVDVHEFGRKEPIKVLTHVDISVQIPDVPITMRDLI